MKKMSSLVLVNFFNYQIIYISHLHNFLYNNINLIIFNLCFSFFM